MKKKQLGAVRNLRLVMFESAVTAGMISMSIMTPFFYSIGLTQFEVSLTQIIFTIVMIILDVPMGWVADRFSRKWANVIGDLGAAAVFIGYAFVNSFWAVVTCELLLGCFMALSQGVDQSLLKHFCEQIQPGDPANRRMVGDCNPTKSQDDFFRRKTAQLNCLQYICTLTLTWLGGPIGAISFRLAIFLSGVPRLVAGLVSIFIKDDSKRLKPQSSPLKDMRRIMSVSLRQRPLRVRMFAYAIGREMTHAMIWVFTPLLVKVGVPMSIVSLAWALNAVTCLLGAGLAKRFALKLKDWQVFVIPLLVMWLSMGVMSYRLNIVTVWFYLLMGVVQGWTSATLLPLVQHYVRPEEQTTVVSFTHVCGRLVYIVAALLIGWVTDIKLELAPLANLVFFAICGGWVLMLLRRDLTEN